MSLEDLKREVEEMAPKTRDQLFFHIAKLRHRDDPDFWREIRERTDDKNPENWLTPARVREKLGAEG